MDKDNLRAEMLSLLVRGLATLGPIALQLLLRKLEKKQRDSLNRQGETKS